MVQSRGPSNNREYKVVVYFKNRRLASATGSTIQQAEMNAAKAAMEKKEGGDKFIFIIKIIIIIR